jgi:hypothetical protein
MLFEGVGRVAAGLEQTGAGRLRLSVQTPHIHVQQTAGVLAQTSRHHDLLNISSVDHVHHRADRIMRGIDGDATSSYRDDVGLFAGCQRADLIGKVQAGRAIDRRSFEDRAHLHSRRCSALAKNALRLGYRPLLEERGAHFGEHVAAHGCVHVHAQRWLKTMIDRRLERQSTGLKAEQCVGPGVHRHMRTRGLQQPPLVVGEARTVVEDVVRAE